MLSHVCVWLQFSCCLRYICYLPLHGCHYISCLALRYCCTVSLANLLSEQQHWTQCFPHNQVISSIQGFEDLLHASLLGVPVSVYGTAILLNNTLVAPRFEWAGWLAAMDSYGKQGQFSGVGEIQGTDLPSKGREKLIDVGCQKAWTQDLFVFICKLRSYLCMHISLDCG